MAIRNIARMGDPILRQVARAVPREEIPSLSALIQDMIETMHEHGGLGLAAPQVFESLRVVVMEFEENNARYPGMGSQPLLILINPEITVLDPTPQSFWEGCLSVPELRGFVARPSKILVNYLDREGHAQSLLAEGFLATVFQHEIDHLDGTLFVDRLQTAKNFFDLSVMRDLPT